MGKMKLYLGAWGMMITALRLAMPADAQETQNCPPLRALTTIDLTLTPSGSLQIPVGINGQLRKMVLDTGAPYSTISKEAVEELALPQMHSMSGVQDVLGNRSEMLAQIPEFTLGRLKTKDLKVYIMPGHMGARSKNGEPPPIGLFGADFLRAYDVDIDFAARKLRLISPEHCPGKVVYWHPAHFAEIPFTLSDTGHIFLPVKLDGADAKAILDTGASGLMVREAFVKRHFDIADDKAHKAVINNETIDGVYRKKFEKLELNGLAISNPVMVVMPDVARGKQTAAESWYRGLHNGQQDDMLLGIPVLSKLHLYIAYREKRIFISQASDKDAKSP